MDINLKCEILKLKEKNRKSLGSMGMQRLLDTKSMILNNRDW